jgi:hypothetical protein
MLVNDLDLRIMKDGVTYYPWTLDGANPSAPARRDRKNMLDNVEQVLIDLPEEGIYSVYVDYNGTLKESPFVFLIILSTTDRDSYRIQGTSDYIAGVQKAPSLVLLTGCFEGYHHLQGGGACIQDDVVPSPDSFLPMCEAGTRLVQGTWTCEAVIEDESL